MPRVRPTLRVLRDDLKLPLPSARTPLDAISHPLLNKAAEQFTDPDTAHERIRAIDDVVLFKVKCNAGAAPSEPTTPTPRSPPGWSPQEFARTAPATTSTPRWKAAGRRPAPATTANTTSP
ncbi:hypothetical protein [Nonomuraea deserti]|uniref:hypothetical protein n=1 Tax=Nonomuraea deserti TaxID=1848322 RepID=UPI001C70A146|nr:hypothetical protein [Nonomuraea deserti]